LNIENAERKLQHARFFLDQMAEQEGMAFDDKAKFDFYLSGFLSSGMSVRDAFHVEQDRKRNEAIKAWKKVWEARLTPDEACLWDFMREDHNHEVDRSSSSRTVKTKVGIASVHSDKSGTVAAMGSPWAGPVVIYKPTYNFTIAGAERKATEACGEYLALLERMVAAFKADRRMRRMILLRVAHDRGA
jgi:hypothetical protein